MIFSKSYLNGIEIFTGENDHIKFEIAPSVGGKILSVYNKHLHKEFLWRNKNLMLEIHQPGTDYDPNFFGGIDELIPNDIPEEIDSVAYPDHGELWTTSLDYTLFEDKISVFGKLKLSGLYYSKTVYIEKDSPVIYLKYTIRNETSFQRNFLWKMHAALAIEGGDKLVTGAQKAKVADPAYSRFSDLHEFDWPLIENTDASIIPSQNNSIDFFYFYDIEQAEMKLLSSKGDHLFKYSCDKKIFPYQWYFASYGGFLDHYMAVLEPATSVPLSVNEAKAMTQCSVLEPDGEINTIVCIYAGKNDQ